MPMLRLLLIISLAVVAANCGQKGPLEPPTAEMCGITPEDRASIPK